MPAIDTIFAHAIQPCRRIDTYSFCQGGKDLHHEGNGRFQLGNGGMAGFGKRPCTGGTMVQGPRFATLNRVSALGLDALPVTVDTHGLTPVALAKEVFIYIEGCMPSNSL